MDYSSDQIRRAQTNNIEVAAAAREMKDRAILRDQPFSLSLSLSLGPFRLLFFAFPNDVIGRFLATNHFQTKVPFLTISNQFLTNFCIKF